MLKSLIDPIGKLLDKLIPDADKRQEAKVKLAELESKSDSTLLDIAKNAMATMNELNLIDAKSDDKYRTRWRPTIGWICVFGLGWEFIVRPFVVSAVVIFTEVDQTLIPSLDMAQIIGLTTTLLGMGALRTYEKSKGKS
jgi:hypothetical protein